MYSVLKRALFKYSERVYDFEWLGLKRINKSILERYQIKISFLNVQEWWPVPSFTKKKKKKNFKSSNSSIV